jgi:hypothetical protein
VVVGTSGAAADGNDVGDAAGGGSCEAGSDADGVGTAVVLVLFRCFKAPDGWNHRSVANLLLSS